MSDIASIDHETRFRFRVTCQGVNYGTCMTFWGAQRLAKYAEEHEREFNEMLMLARANREARRSASEGLIPDRMEPR